MPSAFNVITNDIMDPYNVAQLADDTAIIPNVKNTYYCHFNDNFI